MRSSRRELAALALVAASLSAAPTARGAPTDADRARATALFERGRSELARGALAEACGAFAESQRLDPAGGTLLNLALCHERQGRFATAAREFREALSGARRDRKKSRADAAEAHLAGLAPKIPRATIRVPDAARAPGLALSLDGAPLPPSAWGEALELDPGDHVLRASAPSRVARELPLRVAPGDALVVDVAPLDPEPPPSAATAASPAAPASSVAPPTAPTEAPPPSPRRAPAVGWASLGLGAASLTVGGLLGARAISTRGDVEAGCPEPSRCTPALAAKNDRAVRDADRATVAFTLGAVASAFGAIWLWGPGAKRTGAAWVAPVVSSAPGVAAGGRF